MPHDLKLRRCEPPARVTHIALARWVTAALADRGFSSAQTSQIAQVNCGWTAEAALKLTQCDGDGYIDAKDCLTLWETAFALWERGPAGGRPEFLPLILHEMKSPSLSVLGFHMATAPTVRQACEAFMAGAPLLSTSGAWTCLEYDGEVTFSFEHAGATSSARVFNEVMLLIFLRSLAQVSDASLLPTRVALVHERNGNSLAFDRAVRTKVSYSADVNQVTFAARQLERPLRLAHPDMHRHFGSEIRRTLGELNLEADIVEALRRQLRREAVLTQECLVEASSRLGVSARTLQRRLQLAGTSFSDELLAVRRERAHQLVAFSRRPLSEVASALGFADRAAFSRAFRRWFDASPGRVRLNSCQTRANSWQAVAGNEAPCILDESRGA